MAYDFIYLAPHLDDAALSCGGQIHQAVADGRSVLIVTVMAGEPAAGKVSDLAAELHQRWQLAHDVVSGRQAEDVAACRRLGAAYQHWEIPDCIYRLDPVTGEPLYGESSDLFGPVAPADEALVRELARRFRDLPEHGRLIVPLTIGNHVDHQIVRAAAESCDAGSLFYYEDYPYVRHLAPETALHAPGHWQADIIGLQLPDIQARIEAINCYRSQISTFFTDRQDLADQVTAYIHSVGGERLWSLSG